MDHAPPAPRTRRAIFLARLNLLNFHAGHESLPAQILQDAEGRAFGDAMRITAELKLASEECLMMQPHVYEYDTTFDDGKKQAQRGRTLFEHTVCAWDRDAAADYGGGMLVFGLDVYIRDTTTPRKKKTGKLTYNIQVDFVAPQAVTSEPLRDDAGNVLRLNYPRDKYVYIAEQVLEAWLQRRDLAAHRPPADV